DRPLWLGALKSNIGHTQAAAGVTGVIKMVQAMRHGVLPRTLHVDEPSRHVDWTTGRIRILTEATPWPGTDRPRRAGVSSFGASGTNAHLILEAPDAAPPADDSAPAGPQPLVVSGRDANAVREQCERLAAHLTRHPQAPLAQVAGALARRSLFEHRAAVVATDRTEAVDALRAAAAGVSHPSVRTGSGPVHGGAVWVFSGQGAQWAGMATELLAAGGAFAERLGQCRDALAPFVDWDLFAVLTGEAGQPSLDRVDVVQPALWAVMVALAAAWEEQGAAPAAVLGHSQGEIAAATVAGVLSLDDGARVVALRSQLITSLAGHGGMTSLALEPARVRELLTALDLDAHVAAVNSPGSTVVSGSPGDLDALERHCDTHGIRARRVPVDYASHSPHVERLRTELLDRLAPVSPRRTRVPFYSSLTGTRVDGDGLDAAYWYRNLRHTVEFETATRALVEDGHTAFLEVSPHPVLALPLQQTLEDTSATAPTVQGTLRRDLGGPDTLAEAAAQAHAHGISLQGRAATALPDLPTYPFQGDSHWLTGLPTGGDAESVGQWPMAHPLLGAAVHRADGDGLVVTGRVSAATQPWLADHVVRDAVLFPGTAFVEAAIRSGDEVGCSELEELVLEAPLVLDGQETVGLQITVGAADPAGRRPVSVHSTRQDGTADGVAEHGEEIVWVRHASGFLRPAAPDEPDTAADFAEWPPRHAEPVPVEDAYDRLARAGYGYGPLFRGLRALWRRDDEAFAEIELADEDAARGWSVHPGLLDGALHPDILRELAEPEPDGLRLPFSWHAVTVHASGATALRVRLSWAGPDGVSLLATDPTGAPVVSVGALTTRPMADGATAPTADQTRNALFRTEWQPAPQPESGTPQGSCLVAGPG
ncbi:acyltransferase domain-containing protein, partial [Streptomyces sparsus]